MLADDVHHPKCSYSNWHFVVGQSIYHGTKMIVKHTMGALNTSKTRQSFLFALSTGISHAKYYTTSHRTLYSGIPSYDLHSVFLVLYKLAIYVGGERSCVFRVTYVGVHSHTSNKMYSTILITMDYIGWMIRVNVPFEYITQSGTAGTFRFVSAHNLSGNIKNNEKCQQRQRSYRVFFKYICRMLKLLFSASWAWQPLFACRPLMLWGKTSQVIAVIGPAYVDTFRIACWMRKSWNVIRNKVGLFKIYYYNLMPDHSPNDQITMTPIRSQVSSPNP